MMTLFYGLAIAALITDDRVALEVTTLSGHVYIAGVGRTCEEAWRGAIIPMDFRAIDCVAFQRDE